jgi:hypothetical protein
MKSVSRIIRPEQVISLTVSDDRFRSGIGLFFSLFNGLEFTRLRSLIIKRMRDKDLEHLLQSLNTDSLISFSIESGEWKYDPTWIVVSYALARRNIRKLCMINLGKDLLILQQLPKSRTLVMQNCTINEKIVPLTSPASTYHALLQSLTITNCSLSSENLELLLARIPAVRHLKLISYRKQFDSMFKASYWQQLICTKLPNLDRFEFFFSCDYRDNNNFIDLASPIDPFRAPFWLNEKHWFVAWAYVLKSHQIWLYTTSIDIIDSQRPVRCEVSSIENTWRLTQRPLNGIVDNTSDEVCNQIDQRKN